MTVRELLKELLKDELRLDDEIRFYYMKQDELIGCEVESIAYRDQVEFTIFDDLQTTDFHNPSSKVSNE
jgi:hypothetical protein